MALAAIVAFGMSDSASAEGTFFRPEKQVLPPAETKTSAQSAESAQVPTSPSYPEVLSGAPSVVDTATLVVDGHRVLLSGLVGLTGQFAQGLQTFIAGYGNAVTCTLIGLGPYYRCVTASQNVDVAEAALLNGAARASADATPSQRSKETQARNAGRGVWASSNE
jgi:endonuclease YncB( thermonuclease family)